MNPTNPTIDIPNPLSGIDLSWLNPARITKLLLGILLIFVGVFAVLFDFTSTGATKIASLKGKMFS